MEEDLEMGATIVDKNDCHPVPENRNDFFQFGDLRGQTIPHRIRGNWINATTTCGEEKKREE
jgi:hypothetical protein